MDSGAWRATVHKKSDMNERTCVHTHTHTHTHTHHLFHPWTLNILRQLCIISGPEWQSPFSSNSSRNPGTLGHFLQKVNFHFLTYFSGNRALRRIWYFIQSLGVVCSVKHPLEENRPQSPALFQATADLTIVNNKLCPLFSKQQALVRLKHLESCSPSEGWEERHLTHQGQSLLSLLFLDVSQECGLCWCHIHIFVECSNRRKKNDQNESSLLPIFFSFHRLVLQCKSMEWIWFTGSLCEQRVRFKCIIQPWWIWELTPDSSIFQVLWLLHYPWLKLLYDLACLFYCHN